jgi:hypothetical protein
MEDSTIARPFMGFPSFQQLPDDVRARIWRLAAFVPRVVSVYEEHSSTYGYNPATKEETCEDATRIKSHTRPPAILSVNRESRTQALCVYVSMYTEYNTLHKYSCKGPTPIYTNPFVDITYRGKQSCRWGDAFKIRYGDYAVPSGDIEPLAATSTLAVDIVAVRRVRPISTPSICDEKALLQQAFANRMANPTLTAAEQILACAEKGLKELIIIVGNDDDLSEITLIPATPISKSASDIFHQAELKAEALRYALALNSPTPPTVRVMTPKRLPLIPFPFFPKFPQEIQNIIWSYACEVPRVIAIEHTGGLLCDEVKIKNPRVPPLLHACQTSRAILKAKLTRGISLPGDRYYPYYNPLVDTVHLPMYGISSAKLGNHRFRSVAVSNSHSFGERFTGADAKALRTEEIVILAGGGARARTKCEVMIVPARTYPGGDGDRSRFDCRAFEASSEKYHLEESMRKKLRSWEKYQARRRRKGLSSPDWIVPKVKIARLMAVTQVLSPYSY